MRILIFAILLLLPPLAAGAVEDIPLGVSQIDVSQERGSHNSVIATAQDSDGYVWLATPPGLYVYDGNLVRPVLEDQLRDTGIQNIHIDTGDTLWVATNSGILQYSLKTGVSRWHREPAAGEAPAVNTAYVIYEDSRGTLWAGTSVRTAGHQKTTAPLGAGLHRYEPSFGRFERLDDLGLPPEDMGTVFDICEDRQRNLWMATDRGVYRLAGNQWPATFIPLSTGEAYRAKRLAFDGAGNLWVTVANSENLWRLPADAAGAALLPVEDVKKALFTNLARDSEGDMLICSTRGLFRYAHEERVFYRHPLIQEQSSQPPKSVMSAFASSTGNLWIGTPGSGVLRHTARPGARIVKLRQSSRDSSSPVTSILHFVVAPDSRIYVAPKGGGVFQSILPASPNRLNMSSTLEVEPVFEGEKVKAMAMAPDGSLICGLQGALLRTGPNRKAERVQVESSRQFTDQDIEHVTCTRDGRIWLASKFDLHSFIPGQASPKLEKTLSGGEFITCLQPVEDSLWLSHGRNITRIESLTGRQSSIFLPALVQAENATIKEFFVENPETLWIGTTKNLFRYNLKSGALTQVRIAARERIADALSFISDAQGSIWLHTQDRIFRVPPGSDQAEEVLLGAGHPSVSISAHPVLMPGNVLLYGHTNGLLLVDPERIFKHSASAPIISDIRIFGTPLPATRTGRMPAHLELDHFQNYLTFTFTQSETSSFHRPRFFYFLEGVDSGWNDAGQQSSISYAHLKPGRYSLRVKDGLDGAHVTTLSMDIRAPWWMTTWAKAGYALAFVTALLAASRAFARIQTSRIRKEMLENLVMQDPLTEVPNRRKFKEVLAAEKSRCKRSNHQISVLMIDIDFFKGFNDRFGHQAGDKALRKVAQTLSSTLRRPEDFVARFGGEEFVVVLPSTNRAGAERVAQKIQDAIFQADIPYPGSPLSDRVTLSIGISTFSPQTDLHIDSGLFSADQALYQAKRNGRNCVFYKDHCLALTPVRQ